MYAVLESRIYREWAELSQKEKNTHLYDYQKSAVCQCLHDIGSDDVSMHLKDTLDELDLPSDDIAWSLSNCQGDGVAFYGKVIMTEKLLATILGERAMESLFIALRYMIATDALSITYRLSRNDYGRYYTHGRCIQCEILEVYGGDTSRLPGVGGTSKKMENAIYEAAELLLEYVRAACVDLEETGYGMLEGVLEDEYISEFCLVNGILFDEQNRPVWNVRERIIRASEEHTVIEINSAAVSRSEESPN